MFDMEMDYWKDLKEAFIALPNDLSNGVEKCLRRQENVEMKTTIGIIRMTCIGSGGFGTVWKVFEPH